MQRKTVGIRPETRHHADADRRGQRMVAELFAGLHIAEMHLDGGQFHGCNRIADRHGGVRVGGRIYDDAVDPLLQRGADPVNDRAFVIGLEVDQLASEFLRQRPETRHDRRQRVISINPRLPDAQELQVRPIDQQYFQNQLL